MGAVALALVRKLSEADQCAIKQRLLDHTPDGSDVESESQVETTLVARYITGFLVSLFIGLAMFFIWVIHYEVRRYRGRNAKGQGKFSQYLKYRFGYWYTWTSGSACIVLLSMCL